MSSPSARLLLVVAACGLLAACGTSVPATLGEACGASHGCADGLTCHSGTCVSVAGPDGGTTSDGGPTRDGGTATDGGTGDGGPASDGGTSDGGTVTDGGTSDGGATCGPCDTPPDVCHATVGTCQNGACVYPTIDGVTCDDGNPCTVQDTCQNGVCAGTPMVCNTPPAPACLSGTELSTYDQTGVCQGGRCTYTKKTVTCGSGGCVNNACQTDPCASVTCNAPPSVCYGTAGTCSNGSCTYPYADGTTCNDNDPCTTNDQCNTGVCKGTPVACDNPPASTCTGPNTAKIYAPAGTCSVGTCSYTYSFVNCASGCVGGACNPSGWTPMTSNVSVDLYAVWGTSATDVWAVGASGTALHFNGVKWSIVSTGNLDLIGGITGTSSTDVMAIAQGSTGLDFLHYDGTGWSKEASIDSNPEVYPIPIHSVGPDDAIVSGWIGGGGFATSGVIDEDHAGTTTRLTSNANEGASSLWAFADNDVYLVITGVLEHFDGTALSKVTTPATGLYALWAASPSAIYASAGGNVLFYDGTTWKLMNTGLNGSIAGLTGLSKSRLFALASTSTTQMVLIYDGTGWTPSPFPASTPTIQSIWAAPDGEVFAVGIGGTILHGP